MIITVLYSEVLVLTERR